MIPGIGGERAGGDAEHRAGGDEGAGVWGRVERGVVFFHGVTGLENRFFPKAGDAAEEGVVIRDAL